MATTLLDDLSTLVSPRLVSSAAARLGEPEDTVARGLHEGGAATLAGLASRSADAGFGRQLMDLVTNRDVDDRFATDYDSLGMPGTASTNLGARLLDLAFPGQSSGVADVLSRSLGLRGGVASSLLSIAAPLVLSLLTRRVRAGGLDAGGLLGMLTGQRDALMAAAPAGLGSLLGMGGARAGARAGGMRDVPPAAEPAPRMAAAAPERSGNRWLWPAIAALALVALLWGLSRRDRTPEPVVATRDAGQMVDSAAGRVGEAAGRVGAAVGGAGAAVAAGARDLGATVRRNLPGGRSLDVPENGIESRLVSFIESDRAVNDTTWFDFDRITFETGSARLAPQSDEQLQNIAAILTAYPNVRVKIGGYTDNTGDPAANQRLSQERADAVRRALTERGIAANRLEAEGYGEQHPVADNATEEGRAQNRRIALRVTRK